MLRKSILGLLSLLLTAGPLSAVAADVLWLDTAPARYFTAQDWEALSQGVTDALEEAADGETLTWDNPTSGSSGQITVLRSYMQETAPCRSVRTRNRAGGLQGGAVYDFCQQPDGDWKIVPPQGVQGAP